MWLIFSAITSLNQQFNVDIVFFWKLPIVNLIKILKQTFCVASGWHALLVYSAGCKHLPANRLRWIAVASDSVSFWNYSFVVVQYGEIQYNVIVGFKAKR
jgi:hypothetical protein